MRLGHDVFLGEVVIPLREVEDFAASKPTDVRRYILGRRNAKEKVTGLLLLQHAKFLIASALWLCKANPNHGA